MQQQSDQTAGLAMLRGDEAVIPERTLRFQQRFAREPRSFIWRRLREPSKTAIRRSSTR